MISNKVIFDSTTIKYSNFILITWKYYWYDYRQNDQYEILLNKRYLESRTLTKEKQYENFVRSTQWFITFKIINLYDDHVTNVTKVVESLRDQFFSQKNTNEYFISIKKIIPHVIRKFKNYIESNDQWKISIKSNKWENIFWSKSTRPII